MAIKFLTNDEVAERAQRWVRLWRNEKYRSKMDDVLKGLNEADTRRVILCGQRMSGGLPLKVIPAPQQQGKEAVNGEAKKATPKQRRPSAASAGTGDAKGKTSVGANSSAAKGGHGRARSRRA